MNYKTELGVWVVASLLLSIAGAWLTWRFRHAQSKSMEWLKRRLVEGTPGRIFLQLVRLAYYVGLPYLAVLRRALSLVVVGVRGPELGGPAWWTLGWRMSDWAQSIGWAASLGALIAAVLALGWRNAVRAQGQLTARGLWPASPWWVTLREVVYNEVHWTFYRAVPLLIFDDVYWALLVSAAFPWLEWALDPDWWVQLNDGPRREQVLLQCLWLALSSTAFFLTRNFWLVCMLRLALALGLNGWLAFLAGPKSPEGA